MNNTLKLLIPTIIVIIAATGLFVLAMKEEQDNINLENSYKVDYSESLMYGSTADFEPRTFQVRIGDKRIFEENTIEKESDSQKETLNTKEDKPNTATNSVDSRGYRLLTNKEISKAEYKNLTDLWAYGNNWGRDWNSNTVEKIFRLMKEQGLFENIQNGDIITIKYDEPSLTEKGSADIHNILVSQYYDEITDRLNNTTEYRYLDNYTLSITPREAKSLGEKLDYIGKQLRSEDTEYTIEFEITAHVEDYKGIQNTSYNKDNSNYNEDKYIENTNATYTE